MQKRCKNNMKTIFLKQNQKRVENEKDIRRSIATWVYIYIYTHTQGRERERTWYSREVTSCELNVERWKKMRTFFELSN